MNFGSQDFKRGLFLKKSKNLIFWGFFLPVRSWFALGAKNPKNGQKRGFFKSCSRTPKSGFLAILAIFPHENRKKGSRSKGRKNDPKGGPRENPLFARKIDFGGFLGFFGVFRDPGSPGPDPPGPPGTPARTPRTPPDPPGTPKKGSKKGSFLGGPGGAKKSFSAQKFVCKCLSPMLRLPFDREVEI